MQANDQPIHWPANPAPYLTDWLFEIGPVSVGGLGEAEINWIDLAAWSAITGIELDPWEARTIRRLSRAYLSQKSASKKSTCAAPYTVEIVQQRNDKVTSQFAAMVSALGKAGDAKAP